jgi:hypothetical protein
MFLEELREIKKNDWHLPKDLNPDVYALEIYPFLGDPDPELRDQLTLTLLCVLIQREKLYKNTCRALLEKCRKEGIFHRIEEPVGDEGVYKRSFALLLIAALVEDHNKAHRAWMSREIFVELVDDLMEYAEREHDLHGYRDQYGWAHTVAHLSDALAELAACRELDEEAAKEILTAIITKMNVADYAYIHGEDERMAHAATALVYHQRISLLDWERILEAEIHGPDMTLPGQLRLQMEHNMKNFLRSLLARIQRLGLDEKWTFPVISALRKYDVKY